MIIQSLHGVFSISIAPENEDKLLVRSNNIDSLCRLFDKRRVKSINFPSRAYGVSICKEELSNVLIKMVKQIDYDDFDQYMSDLVLEKENLFVNIVQ
ncbi:hypothetical protein [Mongoliitalea daihaiensis]|uniref:hypothetical protein n=1 Tax=Mongoliitalea daihaiensis TaxID=2782006 RepID=UPI001F185D50|nr:hypothetical protein [Mongoliitalea daihaiensis]UJP64057.1 hypothetical protein IPZ59_14690 [Mongoliitalea daihaiensis]